MRAAAVVWKHLVSLLFPEGEEVARLHALTPEDLWREVHKAPDVHEPDIYALFDYKDETMKALIWRLKYKKDTRTAALLGEVLAAFIEEIVNDIGELSRFENPVLVPIPLSQKRLESRGYNQASLLIEEARKYLPDCVALPSALVKTKDTPPQTDLSREERLSNITGCFIVPSPQSVQGQSIIVVDDVTTTGSTLHEAMQTLRKAGARNVIGVAVAH